MVRGSRVPVTRPEEPCEPVVIGAPGAEPLMPVFTPENWV